MTAEMIDEATVPTPEDIIPETYERPTLRTPSEPNTAALATPEELAGLDRLIAAFEKELGPVPAEIQEQFDADLAAADAEIGRIR